jgi:acyl carrier protein
MNSEILHQTIVVLLQQIAPDTTPETLKLEENIRETLNIDSFDFLQFVIALHEKTGVEIPEEDYGKINTIQNAIEYIQNKSHL